MNERELFVSSADKKRTSDSNGFAEKNCSYHYIGGELKTSFPATWRLPVLILKKGVYGNMSYAAAYLDGSYRSFSGISSLPALLKQISLDKKLSQKEIAFLQKKFRELEGERF